MFGKLLTRMKSLRRKKVPGTWCVSCKDRTDVYVTGYAVVDGPKGTSKRMLGTCVVGHKTSTFVAA